VVVSQTILVGNSPKFGPLRSEKLLEAPAESCAKTDDFVRQVRNRSKYARKSWVSLGASGDACRVEGCANVITPHDQSSSLKSRHQFPLRAMNIAVVDIGKPGANFGWAMVGDTTAEGNDIDVCVQSLAAVLRNGPLALGFQPSYLHPVS
jgi:hypothetical protein